MAPPRPPTDQFETFNALIAAQKRSWALNLTALGIAGLSLLLAFVSLSRPLTVVYSSDDPNMPRRVVSAAQDQAPREVDAKRFFIQSAQRLHGWNSATVEDELTKASRLMTPDWRKRFLDEVNALVPVPVEIDQSGKASRLATYIAARVRNDLEVDFDSLKCSQAEGFWHCKATAQMETQPLLGDPVNDPKLKRKMSIKASFQVVPTTYLTLDGLLVSFWDANTGESP
jgi:hypothetical protein